MNGTTIVDGDDWDDDEPTERERNSLRKIPDKLPWSAFLVAVVELCERFAYYGMSGPFQNYISNKYHDPSGNPGAIGEFVSPLIRFWISISPIRMHLFHLIVEFCINVFSGLDQTGATALTNFFQFWCVSLLSIQSYYGAFLIEDST
jgi:dipeptide/tripeptide permease